MSRKKKFRSLLATVLAAALLFTTQVPAWAAGDSSGEADPSTTLEEAKEETGEEASGEDEGEDKTPAAPWYAEYQAYCEEKGLFGGVPQMEFDPYVPITRAQIAVIFYRAAGSPAIQGLPYYPFQDVSSTAWYTNGVIWSWRQGVMSGYDEKSFGVNDNMTREQFAVIMWSYAGNPEIAPDAEAKDPFPDADRIASWAKDAVDWLQSEGMVSGREDGSFTPKGTCTQAEAAVILRQYLRYISGEEGPGGVWDVPEHEDPPAEDPSKPEQPHEPGVVRPNTYDPSHFTRRNGFLYYDDPSVNCTVGIDVSVYQGIIDWQQVAAAGVDFAIIRLGYQGYGTGKIVADTYWRQNIEGALAAGVEVGVYLFSQAINETEAAEQAHLVLDTIKGYNITYPVVFDWEIITYDGSRTKYLGGDVITRCAQTFCRIVEDAGYIPMTYANPSDISYGRLDLAQVTDWPFWLAHYTSLWNPTRVSYSYDMWQYSSTGSVPGIAGNVDLDICMTDFSWFKK